MWGSCSFGAWKLRTHARTHAPVLSLVNFFGAYAVLGMYLFFQLRLTVSLRPSRTELKYFLVPFFEETYHTRVSYSYTYGLGKEWVGLRERRNNFFLLAISENQRNAFKACDVLITCLPGSI